MKYFFILLMLFGTQSVFSQTKIKILDLESKLPIPYAKVIFDHNEYRNCEEDGTIEILDNEKILQIENFGYETYKVTTQQPVFYLKRTYIAIDEVVLSKPKFKNIITIGSITKKRNSLYISENSRWIVAKEIKYSGENAAPLFLKSVKFATDSRWKQNTATIKMNIYSNESGLPGELLHSETVTCKKNEKITKVIIKKNINFPKNGLIIGFEWIINEENSYSTIRKFADGSQKKITYTAPALVTEKDKDNIITGSLVNGDWKFKNHSIISKSLTPNLSLQIELTD